MSFLVGVVQIIRLVYFIFLPQNRTLAGLNNTQFYHAGQGLSISYETVLLLLQQTVGLCLQFFHVLCLLIHLVYLSLSSFPALFTPEGVTRYQNQSVMNVVISLSHSLFQFSDWQDSCCSNHCLESFLGRDYQWLGK